MASQISQDFQVDTADGLSRGWRIIGVSAVASLAISVAFSIAISWILGAAILFAGLVFFGLQAIWFLSAKSRVLKDKEVSLFAGLGRLIAWNPSEGVIFLRNKQINFVDDNSEDGGGIRIIFPILGEELAARVPLEVQTTGFSDSGILTKEFIPLSMKATIFWRISDLTRFYLSLSREVHQLSDSGEHGSIILGAKAQVEAAERWLSSMMEEQTRAIISRTGTGLLIYDRVMDELPSALPGEDRPLMISGPESSEHYRSTTDGLAQTVKAAVNSGLLNFGIIVDRIALQQVNMPPEIYAAAVEACKSAYAPLRAKAEAFAEQMKLRAKADVLGKEAVGLSEIASSAPALAVQDLLGPLFQQFSRRSAGSQQ